MSSPEYVSMQQLFTFSAARSKGIDDYEPGPTPFVTSTMLNNGVVGYVTPRVGDKVFDGPALSISGLGGATVQLTRFLPKGNGGDSLTICKPIRPMTRFQLIAAAAAFNSLHAWRFSFGRKCSVGRVAPLLLPAALPDAESIWNDEAISISSLVQDLR